MCLVGFATGLRRRVRLSRRRSMPAVRSPARRCGPATSTSRCCSPPIRRSHGDLVGAGRRPRPAAGGEHHAARASRGRRTIRRRRSVEAMDAVSAALDDARSAGPQRCRRRQPRQLRMCPRSPPPGSMRRGCRDDRSQPPSARRRRAVTALPSRLARRRRRRPTGAPPPLPRSIGTTGRGWLVAAAVLLVAVVDRHLRRPRGRRATTRSTPRSCAPIAALRTDVATPMCRRDRPRRLGLDDLRGRRSCCSSH